MAGIGLVDSPEGTAETVAEDQCDWIIKAVILEPVGVDRGTVQACATEVPGGPEVVCDDAINDIGQGLTRRSIDHQIEPSARQGDRSCKEQGAESA